MRGATDGNLRIGRISREVGKVGRILRAMVLACAMGAAAMPAMADPLTYAQLKALVEGMGYTPSDLTKNPESPIFEVTLTTANFKIPLAMEVSKSGRYVWVRATLGASKLTGDGALAMLKKQAELQPTMFWINSGGSLLVGMAVDNRDITPAHMRFVMDKVAADIDSTSALWAAQ